MFNSNILVVLFVAMGNETPSLNVLMKPQLTSGHVAIFSEGFPAILKSRAKSSDSRSLLVLSRVRISPHLASCRRRYCLQSALLELIKLINMFKKLMKTRFLNFSLEAAGGDTGSGNREQRIVV